jgi:predicted transcriptional regulator
MRPSFVGFILFLCAGLFVPISGFAAPFPVDNSPQFRDTVQGHDGTLHTVWLAQHGRTSSLLYQVTDVGGQPHAGPIVIADSSARIRRPQVAVAQSSGNGAQIVHFIWQERSVDGTGQETAIRYATLTLAPAGAAPLLSHPVTINRDPAAMHPSLAVDQAGWAYAAWEIEGRDVVLAAIDPAGRVSQIRHITNHDTNTEHALPAVAVDRHGNVHLVWTAQSGDRTQLVYKAFRGHGGQVLEKERIIYTTRGDLNQAKVLTFDRHGDVKISWVSSPGRRAGRHGHGRPARLGATVGRGYLLLRHGHSGGASTVAIVEDHSLTAVPGPVVGIAGEAVITPKPRLGGPASGAASLLQGAAPPMEPPPSAGGDDTVSKLMLERLLRYATWSAAPPSVREIRAARPLPFDLSACVVNFRFMPVVLPSLFQSGSVQAGVYASTNPSAFQPILFTQGGDTIA